MYRTAQPTIRGLLCLCCVLMGQPGPAASADLTLEAVLARYESLKPHVMVLISEIRETRTSSQAIDPGKILLVRKEVSDFVRTLRRYDKDHLRAAKGVKTYPDRDTILRLFHVADVIHRLLEAETKSSDYQMLGLKYEETWKQADGALEGDATADR